MKRGERSYAKRDYDLIFVKEDVALRSSWPLVSSDLEARCSG